MLLGMIFRLYSEIFVEIHALFLEILRFEFVTLFVKHPVARGQLVRWLPHINEGVTIARAHVHTPLLYLENG